MTNNLQKFIILSLFIHGIFIIGLSVKWYINIKQSTTSIDVILNNEQSLNDQSPDFLAPEQNLGGGDKDHKDVPPSFASAIPAKNFDESIPLNQTTGIKEQLSNHNPVVTQNDAEQLVTLNEIIKDNNQNANPESGLKDLDIATLTQDIADKESAYSKRSRKRYITTATQQYRDAAYLDRWRKKIEYFGNKYYPPMAKARNLSGDVLLLVAIGG